MPICKMLLSVAVLASFSVVFAADAPKEDAVKEEVKKLQGKWQVTAFIDSSEEAAPAAEIENMTFEFKEDRLTMRKDKDDPGREMKYKLDVSKKLKAIDINMGGTEASEGIYKLDGEVLTICVIAGGRNGKAAARPAEFKASKRDIYTLFVLKKFKS